MSDTGPEQIAVERPRRHRWARREVWFVVAAVVLIVIVAAVSIHRSGRHVAPGVPFGTVPSPAPIVPAPTTGAAPPPTT